MIHSHTCYSISDALGTPEEHATRYKELGREFYCVTEHGTLNSMFQSYKACKKLGLKQVVGMEAYVKATESRNYHHLLLIVLNDSGYNSLLKMLNESYPVIGRMDKVVRAVIKIEDVFKYNEGLVCTSACIGGIIQQVLLNEDKDKAKKWVDNFVEVFGDRFYLEKQSSGIPDQKIVNTFFDELDIPKIVTADSHYVMKEDKIFHDILYTIKNKNSDEIKGLPGDYYHIKSDTELIKDTNKKCVSNCYDIVERCQFQPKFGINHMPMWTISDPDQQLKDMAIKGLKKKYSKITNEISNRLESELEIIELMGFSSYFLIVWDIIKYTKEQNILLGPGRGSGVGSLVAYCLGLTIVDPIKYGLRFEWFLNPGRAKLIEPNF